MIRAPHRFHGIYHRQTSTQGKIDKPVTFFSGPNGSGKTLILKLLRLLAEEPGFMSFDMSDIIKHFKNRPETKLGELFNRHADRQKAGELLPNKPIVAAGMKYIREMDDLLKGGLKHCAFGGGIRNVPQAKRVIKNYVDPRLVIIECTRQESMHGSLHRPNDGREDSSDPAIITKRFELASTETRRGEEYFAARRGPGSVLPIKRSQSMKTKMLMIVGFMNIPETEKKQWLLRIQDPTSRVGREIVALDTADGHVQPISATLRVDPAMIPSTIPTAFPADVRM